MKSSTQKTLPALVLLLGLAACSQNPQTPYAEAYRDALPRFEGTDKPTTEMVASFVTFFSHGGGSDEPVPDPAELYGEPLYFSDTLVTTENREAALKHLRRMHTGTESLQVNVIDTQMDGQDVYLIWQMIATFQPVSSPVTSNTLGMTHLRFDADGRIILQQDFWDSAEGLYRHVPVLGRLIQAVQSRFATDE